MIKFGVNLATIIGVIGLRVRLSVRKRRGAIGLSVRAPSDCGWSALVLSLRNVTRNREDRKRKQIG